MATNDASFLGTPVRSLQSMLRTISFHDAAIPRVVPDGIFGERTLEAVMTFQREHGLPVTGKVDSATWNAVVAAYREAQFFLALPRPANLFPAFFPDIYPGESSLYLFPIQGMFVGLSYTLEEVEVGPVDGVHLGPSVRNTMWLQERGDLKPTGVFDRRTWDLLARLYDTFVMRNPAAAANKGQPGIQR